MADTATPPAAGPPQAESLELAPSKQSAQLIPFGAMPETLAGAWQMANVFAKSTLVPKGYFDKPYDILVAWDMGKQLGFTPLQALQTIANINGRPGVWGDGFIAIIMNSPRYKDHAEFYTLDPQAAAHDVPPKEMRLQRVTSAQLQNDECTAWCVIWVKDRERPFVGSFSIGQAKRAGLTGKDTPWKTYPERMLINRARGYAGRDGFAAELKGLKLGEELRDTPHDDISVSSTPVEPRRRSEVETNGAASETAAVHAEPVAATSETPGPARETRDAKAPSTSTRFTGSTNQVTFTDVLIVKTAFQADTKAGALLGDVPGGLYEITIKKGREETVLMTEDQGLADAASSCEGTGTLCKVTWHGAKLAGKAVKVLDAFEAMV